MTINLNIVVLRAKLIEIYEMYLKNPDNQILKETAQLINSEYRDADELMSASMRKAVSLALNIGLDLEPIPTKEEIKQLIADLKAENEQS